MRSTRWWLPLALGAFGLAAAGCGSSTNDIPADDTGTPGDDGSTSETAPDTATGDDSTVTDTATGDTAVGDTATGDTAVGETATETGPCVSPLTVCGTTCSDTQVDPSNCGACGTVCAAGATCSAGVSARTLPRSAVRA
jgi:hypothetical protein